MKKNNNKIQPAPLHRDSFPRNCSRCGKHFRDEVEFFAETSAIPHAGSDIRAIRDDEEARLRGLPAAVYLEVYRNCQCGTTLMERFHSRRDLSPRGLRRRKAFEEMLILLERCGCDRDDARQKLLDFIEQVT